MQHLQAEGQLSPATSDINDSCMGRQADANGTQRCILVNPMALRAAHPPEPWLSASWPKVSTSQAAKTWARMDFLLCVSACGLPPSAAVACFCRLLLACRCQCVNTLVRSWMKARRTDCAGSGHMLSRPAPGSEPLAARCRLPLCCGVHVSARIALEARALIHPELAYS